MSDIEKNGMPSAVMAGKAALAAMFNEPGRYIGRASAEGIDAECFYLRRPLYDELMDAYRANPEIEKFDMVSFATRLQLSGKLERCGGPSELADIFSYTYDL